MALLAGRRFADHVDGRAVEHTPQSFANHRMVVHDQHADGCPDGDRIQDEATRPWPSGSWAWTRVPAAGGALDDAGAAEEPRALPHAQETEAAHRGRGRLAQTHAVVAHVEMNAVHLAREDDLDARGAGVLTGVREGFLEDPERGGLDGRRQADVAEVLDQAHGPPGVSRRVVEDSGARPGEPAPVDGQRAQGGEDPTSLGDGQRQALGAMPVARAARRDRSTRGRSRCPRAAWR